MRKQKRVIMSIIIAIIIILVAIPTVFASEDTNFSVRLTANKTTVKKGETVEVIIELGEFSNVGKGINSFLGTLEYDKTKLSIESSKIVAQNSWDTPTFDAETGNILTAKGSMITGNEQIIKMTFTVNEAAELGTTKITIKNPEAANDESDFVGTEGTISIQIEEKPTEDPKDDPTEDPKDDPTEDPKDDPTEDPMDDPTDKPSEEPKDEPTVPGTTVVVPDNKEDESTSEKEIPKAGAKTMILFVVIAISIAIIMYRKNKKYEDIN